MQSKIENGGFAIYAKRIELTPLATQLASVLDTAADGILVIDEQARILLVNRACELLFGYPGRDVLGTTVRTILLPDARGEDFYLRNQHRTGLHKIAGVGHVATGRHRDGTIFPVAIAVGEMETPSGTQFTCILRDLRPRREAEQRINQLQAELLRVARGSAMDEMGTALAHELNQPLTALMLYLQSIERLSLPSSVPGLPQPAVRILEKAVREAERAGNIIQRMRRFMDGREPIRRLVDVTILIDDALELALVGARSGMQVTRALAPNLPAILADPVQVQQVVVNLVRNALDAVNDRAEPEIRVAVKQIGGTVALKIEDNGPGIPESTVPHLFEPFSSSKRNGLGLGLVISKAIAQSHGGDLTFEAGGNGKGAAFTLHLPLPRAVAAPLMAAC